MRSLRLAPALVLLVGLGLSAEAGAARGPRPFGLGVQIGAPTGLSAKLYLDRPFALQMGVGWVDDFDNEDGLHLHLDFIWHPAVLARGRDLTLPFYVGVGGRILSHHYHYRAGGVDYTDDDAHLGVRVPVGLLLDFNRVPIDVFLELALVVDFLYFDEDYGPLHHDHDRIDLNGGIGIRYYF